MARSKAVIQKERQRRRLKVLGQKLDESLAARPCGECTACCTVLGVQELDKPVGVTCQHVCEAGCGIYPGRPLSCKTFQCLWRIGYGEKEDRPDLSGVVIYSAHHTSPLGLAVLAREVTPGSFVTSREFIDNVAQNRVVVLISTGTDSPRRIIGPEDEVRRLLPIVQKIKQEFDAARNAG